MFENLKDFKYIRSRKQAFGFYLTYTLGAFIFFMVLGLLLGALGVLGSDPETVKANGQVIGWVLAPVYCMTMSYMVAYHKGMPAGPSLLMTLLAGLLSAFGVFAGMIVAAFLTTRAFRHRDRAL